MDAAPAEIALRLQGIAVTFGQRVVLDVDELALPRGQILAVIGPNGAGKSTLLLIAALLKRPDRGSVEIDGGLATARTTARLRRQVAMVFQAPLLFDVGVLENVASGLRFRGIGRGEANERARHWLERFSVGHLERRGVRGLSAGEAQRVNLARAFATEPSVLLLDEPFAAVDAPSRASLLPEVARVLRATGTSAIFVTHHLAEARVLAEEVAVMFDGGVVQRGPLDELLRRPATEEVDAFFRFSHLGVGKAAARES